MMRSKAERDSKSSDTPPEFPCKRLPLTKCTTVDGIKDESLMVRLRDAFMANGAVQCGFCTPGMLVSGYALLRENPRPTEEEVKTAIEGNICRYTGYVKIIEAILDASRLIAA